ICAHRGEIVAIERDVENSYRRPLAFQIRNLVRHAFGQRHAAAPDPNQIQISGAMVFLEYLRSQPRQRAIDARTVHDAGLLGKLHWLRILTRTVRSDKLYQVQGRPSMLTGSALPARLEPQL